MLPSKEGSSRPLTEVSRLAISAGGSPRGWGFPGAVTSQDGAPRAATKRARPLAMSTSPRPSKASLEDGLVLITPRGFPDTTEHPCVPPARPTQEALPCMHQ